ncbi:MAG TPA: malectin domain-containing carbohydrate-binding protein, partial [Terriglobales bacterium]|nr:malectin domain-containing carbohydrate-binding protein [Terriglobales bacterium]
NTVDGYHLKAGSPAAGSGAVIANNGGRDFFGTALPSGAPDRGAAQGSQVPPPPDFSISATPSSQTINAGSMTTYTVNVTGSNGFTGTVNLGLSGLPSGASDFFTPASVSGTNSSTLTVTTSTATPAGTTTLTITGTSGSLSHSTTVTLTVAGAPAAPSLTGTAGNAQVNLSWTTSSGATSYDVKRSLVTGGPYSLVNSGTVTNFVDTTVTNGTTYFYVVSALNAVGESPNSNEVKLTPTAFSIAINCGGPAISPFVADMDFAGGTTINHANTINLTGVTNPAPMQVYQTARIGNFTYTIPGSTAGSSHTVRLHFAETFWTAAGKRRFNVSINGTQVLTNFDIFATAGAMNKATIQQFTVNANAAGQYVIQFTAVIDKSLVSGIEIQ